MLYQTFSMERSRKRTMTKIDQTNTEFVGRLDDGFPGKVADGAIVFFPPAG